MNQTSIAFIEKRFNGDSVSPVLIFRRLQGNHKFFMESSRQFQGGGEYSYIGVNPVKTYMVMDDCLLEVNNITGIEEKHFGNPFEILNRLVPSNVTSSSYEFSGGLVGHATYDSMVQIGYQDFCEIDLPAMQFDLYDTVIIYSHNSDEVIVIHHEFVRSYEEAKVDELIDQIFHGATQPTQPFSLAPFETCVSDEHFSSAIEQAKRAIENGQAEQLFLTKRLSADFSGDAFTMYRQLRKELLAPYMFYVEFPTYTIMGVAPDNVIQVKGKQVFVTPVTGARPRGATPRDDVKVELTLLQNSREINAHNLLVDSTMADLEKICMSGTVHIVELMKPMQFKHTIRLTTEMEGILKENISPIEALALLLPPAASSGVPKIDAAIIVSSLEGVSRSFSGGIIGFMGFNGNVSFTLLQQAMVIKNNRAYVQAGANVLQDTMEIDVLLEIRKKLKVFLKIDV